MITYEQAKAKALKSKKDIDAALEYKGAYVFYNSKATNETDNEVVILKKNGNAVTMSEYVIDYKDDSEPKRLKF